MAHEASELVFCPGPTTDYFIWGRDLEETWGEKKIVCQSCWCFLVVGWLGFGGYFCVLVGFFF